MKKLLLSALALGLATITNAQTWTQQTSGITSQLNGVKFTDIQNGWAVGDGGIILNTTNGGSTWSSINNLFTGSPINFTELDVIGNSVWACTDNALVLYSTDAGNTWSVSTTPTVTMGTSLKEINFSRQNTNNGWAVGGSSTAGIVFKTTDGGANWTSVNNVPSLSNMPSGVQIISSTIFITDAGMFKKSVDGGLNWTTLNVATNIMKPIALTTSDIWCIQGLNNSQFAYKSTNGGSVFNSFSSTLPMSGYLINIDAIDLNNVMLVSYTGSGYEVFETNNGGVLWSATNLGTITGYVNDISFPDFNNAWVVGNNGNIYKYGSATNIKTEKNETNFSIYPNPSKDIITISSNAQIGEVIISDILGNTVCTVNVKNNEQTIDLSLLYSGIYFITVSNTTTKKIIKE
ncbi:MAG TPA: YCF48-related protein [Bacteroidia bacterium]|nr:YCF48-related protein [Bacteroidia bacterium]